MSIAEPVVSEEDGRSPSSIMLGLAEVQLSQDQMFEIFHEGRSNQIATEFCDSSLILATIDRVWPNPRCTN